MSLDQLRDLAKERGVAWDALASDMSDLYEWQVRAMEANVRFHVVVREVRDDAATAFADATALRDEVLTAGHRLHSRCELGAVAVTDADMNVTSWRGRVELGLQPIA